MSRAVKVATISTGPATHLDHLAPFCFLLDLPLIVTEKEHLELAKKFYPMVETHHLSLQELSLAYLAENFSSVVTCGKFWAMELKPKIAKLFQKEFRVILLPHGYSDKESFLQEGPEQDVVITYQEMGNLRYWFYKEFQEHFDALAKPFFAAGKKTVLYAPTWESKACGTSFFEKMDEVVETIGKECHLIVKLHPLLEENHPAHYHRLLGKYDSIVQFVVEFPPVYPLLEHTDVYLGDYSSVGYDFLHYDHPMFFLKEGGALQACGEPFQGSIESKQNALSTIRKEMYGRVFGNSFSKEKVRALLNKKVGL